MHILHRLVHTKHINIATDTYTFSHTHIAYKGLWHLQTLPHKLMTAAAKPLSVLYFNAAISKINARNSVLQGAWVTQVMIRGKTCSVFVMFNLQSHIWQSHGKHTNRMGKIGEL